LLKRWVMSYRTAVWPSCSDLRNRDSAKKNTLKPVSTRLFFILTLLIDTS
jgi:hypothetical protein